MIHMWITGFQIVIQSPTRKFYRCTSERLRAILLLFPQKNDFKYIYIYMCIIKCSTSYKFGKISCK